MNPLTRISALALLFALLVAACGGSGSAPRAGSTWSLAALTSAGQAVELAAPRPVTLEIGEKNQAGGSAGCNTYFGELKFSAGGKVEVGPIGMTEMWCEDGMQVEAAFGEALGAVIEYQLSEGGLTLSSPDGQYVLVFIPLAE